MHDIDRLPTSCSAIPLEIATLIMLITLECNCVSNEIGTDLRFVFPKRRFVTAI